MNSWHVTEQLVYRNLPCISDQVSWSLYSNYNQKAYSNYSKIFLHNLTRQIYVVNKDKIGEHYFD